MNSQDILDTSRLELDGSFDEQVQFLLHSIRLSRFEVENLVYLYDDLLIVLRNIWPDCEVTPFGSIVTGLGIKTSDVDIHVNTYSYYDPVECVKKARNLLQKKSAIFADLLAIPSAKVPIVKFLHIPTNCYSDINFSSYSGVRNSQLIAYLLQTDIRALHLAILVKYWSKVHKFTGTNLMPNYALTLLVIFYLQQKRILPAVIYLQRNAEQYIVNHWNTAFDDSFLRGNNNKDDLYTLLGGFFEYYASFDFENVVVSTYLGMSLSRNEFLDLNHVSSEYSLYKKNVREKRNKPLRIDTKICVQDPFEHSRNCTVMIYKRLYDQIQDHFLFARNAYQQSHRKHFLRRLLIDNWQNNENYEVTEETEPKFKHNFRNKINKNNFKPNNYKRRIENNFIASRNKKRHLPR